MKVSWGPPVLQLVAGWNVIVHDQLVEWDSAHAHPRDAISKHSPCPTCPSLDLNSHIPLPPPASQSQASTKQASHPLLLRVTTKQRNQVGAKLIGPFL